MQFPVLFLFDQKKRRLPVELSGVAQASRVQTGHPELLSQIRAMRMPEKSKRASALPRLLRETAQGNIDAVKVPVRKERPIRADHKLLLLRKLGKIIIVPAHHMKLTAGIEQLPDLMLKPLSIPAENKHIKRFIPFEDTL